MKRITCRRDACTTCLKHVCTSRRTCGRGWHCNTCLTFCGGRQRSIRYANVKRASCRRDAACLELWRGPYHCCTSHNCINPLSCRRDASRCRQGWFCTARLKRWRQGTCRLCGCGGWVCSSYVCVEHRRSHGGCSRADHCHA